MTSNSHIAVLYIGDTRGNDEDDDKDDDDKHTHTHTHRHTYKATNYAVNRAKESPHISSHGTIHINADITTHTQTAQPPFLWYAASAPTVSHCFLVEHGEHQGTKTS